MSCKLIWFVSDVLQHGQKSNDGLFLNFSWTPNYLLQHFRQIPALIIFQKCCTMWQVATTTRLKCCCVYSTCAFTANLTNFQQSKTFQMPLKESFLVSSFYEISKQQTWNMNGMWWNEIMEDYSFYPSILCIFCNILNIVWYCGFPTTGSNIYMMQQKVKLVNWDSWLIGDLLHLLGPLTNKKKQPYSLYYT